MTTRQSERVNQQTLAAAIRKHGNDVYALNKENWDERTRLHTGTKYYDNGRFRDPLFSALGDAEELQVRQLMPPAIESRLGEYRTRMLHLMSHLGHDTVSLHRMGYDVAGVDFSLASGVEATELSLRYASGKVKFNVYNVIDLPDPLEPRMRFDYIYMSNGVLTWLPFLDKLVQNIDKWLRPGGVFHITERHPALAMFPEMVDIEDGLPAPIRPYFDHSGDIRRADHSYVGDCVMETPYKTYRHTLADIITPFIRHGYKIEKFAENDWSTWPPPKNAEMLGDNITWTAPRDRRAVPLTFTLQTRKGDQ